MIIIRLSGGLGNQMFQYALYLALQKQGKEVKIDDVTEYGPAERLRRPELTEDFGISLPSYERASKEELTELTDARMDILSRVRRKVTGRRTKRYDEKGIQAFDPEVLTLTDAYLCGCWQSEKYFRSAEEEVRRAFTLTGIALDEKSLETEKAIRMAAEDGTAPVSMHIRRGDYLAFSEVYGGICTDEYYEKAIAMMKEKAGECRFFIFTNDPDWAEEKYSGGEFTVVRGNGDENGARDMRLMSCCRHHIIANSSFSWWGSYLSPGEDKIILAPPRFLNNADGEDIYTDRMIRVK